MYFSCDLPVLFFHLLVLVSDSTSSFFLFTLHIFFFFLSMFPLHFFSEPADIRTVLSKVWYIRRCRGGDEGKGRVKPNRAVEDLLTQLQSRWLQRGEGQIAFEDNVFFLSGLYTDALNIWLRSRFPARVVKRHTTGEVIIDPSLKRPINFAFINILISFFAIAYLIWKRYR